MRYPGDNAAGRVPGRRQGPSARVSPSGERPGEGEKPPRGDAALFTPGYSDGRAADHGPVPADGRYGAGSAAGKGPIRGFPPAPGQPPPLYPPGPFAAWNRSPEPDGTGDDPGESHAWLAVDYAGSDGYPGPDDAGTGYADPDLDAPGYGEPGPAPADAGLAETGYPYPGFSEPGYAALAVSDPAADATSTQAWGAVDQGPTASHWPDLSATGEGWPDMDAHQHGTPTAAAFAGALPGPGPAGLDPGAPDVTAPDLAGPAPAGPGRAGPGRAGPGERDPDGWGDPPWAAGPGEATPLRPAADTATGPADRAATGPGPRVPAGAGRAPGGRGHSSRGRARPRGRKKPARTLLVCVLALAVVAGATYLWFSRDHKSPDAAATSQQTTASTRPSPTDPAPSPSPSLGPWGHIGSRALDPVPLTLTELFPAQFTGAGTSYVRTVQKAKTHCAAALKGSQLIAAVSKAGCTQAMRASYLSANHKLMGTIGVLNLITAAAAEKAGKVAGPAEFIAQLPAATGPTRNLAKGTGFEAAEVKGHYLVLVWGEFADLRAPRSAAQRAELDSFISLLFQDTANVSLATREVTGSPPAT
jgi:hypothetical protein